MHHAFKLCAALSLVGLALAPCVGTAEEPAKKQRVYIEACVAEVSLSKLQALGFDWSAIHQIHDKVDLTTGEVPNFIGFLDALAKDDLAKIVSHPRLATMSGRPASLQVGDTIKLDVSPHVLGDEKIMLEYRIELNHSACEFVLDSATELTPGKTCCVSETRRRASDGGKTQEKLTIVLLRADFKPPADIRTAEKPRPPKPATDRRSLDIEVPKRR